MTSRKFGFTLQKSPMWDAEVRRLGGTVKDIEKAVRDELITTAVNIRNHIIRSMSSTPRKQRLNPKTGNIYHSIRGGKIHIPSSPGYAPARDTGDLVKSIKMDVRSNEVEVGSNLQGKEGKYPRFLEYGTKNMEARPWLEPAFISSKAHFYATIRGRVLNSIRNSR